MPDLHAAQAAFAAALRDRSSAADASAWIAGGPARAERGLAVYRANIAAAGARALGDAYPVVRQVVGDEFFEALAAEYRQAHPSTSGDLHEFGAEFPPFVAAFPHTQALPYLADLARLEWAVHRAYGAADAVPIAPAALAAVPPGRQAGLRLHLAGGTAVVESVHPVLRLWQIHQPDFLGEFSVDLALAQAALVARAGLRVTAAALAPAEAAFVGALLAGAGLGEAVEAALASHPDTNDGFDLGASLGRLVSAGLVVGLSHPEES